ncbi:MAG: right-handed parallel beta-helix repeat-containing protein [Actinomycetota bacterium]
MFDIVEMGEDEDAVGGGEGFGEDNPYGWGVLIRNAHHVRVADTTISDMAVGGIASVESSHLDIVGNEVYDNAYWGTEQGSGISLWHSVDSGLGPGADGYHDRIVGNRIHGNENRVYSRWHPDRQTITDGNGIIIDQTNQTGYTGRILVANNVIFDNGGRAVLVLDAARVDIMFNTAYHNGRTPELEGGPVEMAASRAQSVRVFNNLIWGRPGVPPFAVDKSAEVEMGGNLLVTDTRRGPATELDLVVVDDPGLVAPGLDPAAVDFRPRPDSAAVGRSMATDPRVPVDIDGRARPVGAGTPGAYEPGVGTSSTD